MFNNLQSNLTILNSASKTYFLEQTQGVIRSRKY